MKITEAQSVEIAELREKGWSYRRIAEKFGISDGAVHYHCLKQGAFTPKTRGKVDVSGQPPVKAKDGRTQRRFTPAEDERMQELSLKGYAPLAIGRLMGRAPTSIRIRLMTLALHDEMDAA